MAKKEEHKFFLSITKHYSSSMEVDGHQMAQRASIWLQKLIKEDTNIELPECNSLSIMCLETEDFKYTLRIALGLLV